MNNPELRAVLTEALSRSYYRIVGSSSDCRVDPGEILADAILSLPGVAVIQLPEPDEDGNEWIAGREKVFYTTGDEVADVSMVAPVTGSGEAQLIFVEDPQGLAAALLAAAAAATELALRGETR